MEKLSFMMALCFVRKPPFIMNYHLLSAFIAIAVAGELVAQSPDIDSLEVPGSAESVTEAAPSKPTAKPNDAAKDPTPAMKPDQPSTLFPPLTETQKMRDLVNAGDLREDVGLPAPEGGETKTLAIVRDGDSWYFDNLVEEFIFQLEELAVDNYGLEIYEASGDYDPKVIRELLDQAVASPDVDLIYAAGIVATEIATAMPDADRNIPIMAGAVRFSDVRGLRISAEGTSGIPNLTFITNPQRVGEDLRLLRDLTKAKTVHGLIDAYTLPELKGLDDAREEAENTLGISIEVIGSHSTAQETLDAIPEGVESLYVTILPSLDISEREELFIGLAERKIRTVSMLGISDVEIGAMAGLAPDNAEAVSRRTAVNAHQLLQGVSTDLLPVYLPVEDNLVINFETTDAVEWYPNYETVLTAQFINEEAGERGDEIDVAEAMSKAATRNAEVRATAEGERIAEQDVRIVRSNRRLQASIDGNHSRQDFADSYLNFPATNLSTPAGNFTIPGLDFSNNVFQGQYGVQIRRVLFNDEIRSNLQATRETVVSRRLETRSAQLDAMEDAAVAYFNYLSANELYEIEKENLRLTENNLQLAKLRIEIGSAEPSERFRWEQDAARSRATLFQRDSDRDNALVEFNRVMGEPRNKNWDFEDYEVENDEFFFMDDALRPLIENIRDFAAFSEFLKTIAVVNSPELRGFEHNLEAQGILLGQNRRSFFLPEISGFVSQNRTVLGSGGLPDHLSQHESTVGFQFSLPLFEGGRRSAETERQRATIRQLAAQRENALELIEQRTLTAFNGIAAAHPNIRLSRRALEASEKTYESVQEKYSQGAASILDLLDAQSALLLQRQQSAVATYSYLQQIHRLQRSIAWFEYEKTATEKQASEAALKDFLEDGDLSDFKFDPGVTVPEAPDWQEAIVSAAEKDKSKKSKKNKSDSDHETSSGEEEDVALGSSDFEFVEYEIIGPNDTVETPEEVSPTPDEAAPGAASPDRDRRSKTALETAPVTGPTPPPNLIPVSVVSQTTPEPVPQKRGQRAGDRVRIRR